MAESTGQNEGRGGILSRFFHRSPELPSAQSQQGNPESPGLVEELNRIADERNALVAQRVGSVPSDRAPGDSAKIQQLEAEAEKLGYAFGPDNKLFKMPTETVASHADTVTQLVNAMATAREQRAAAGEAAPVNTNAATQSLNREPTSPTPAIPQEKQVA